MLKLPGAILATRRAPSICNGVYMLETHKFDYHREAAARHIAATEVDEQIDLIDYGVGFIAGVLVTVGSMGLVALAAVLYKLIAA